MNEGSKIRRTLLSRPLLLIGGTMLLLIAVLVVWAGRRQTAADKLIQQKLAALRNAGEPINAGDLARMLSPPPAPQDAMLVFSNALEFANAHYPPYDMTPVVGPAPTIKRTEAIDGQTMATLKSYCADTTAVTNLLPNIPPGARFANHWEVGILNSPIVPFAKVRALTQLLGARALYAAENDDAEGASVMLEKGFRFARAIPADSTLVEHMIRVACIGLTCDVADRCLNRTRFNSRQLARILEAMPAADTNGVANTLRVEHCLAIWVFTEVKSGPHLDELTGNTSKEPWWKRAWKRLRIVRGEYNDRDFIAYLDFVPTLQEMARLPPAQAMPRCWFLFSNYQANVTSEVGGAVVANWGRALERHYEVEAHLAATKCALAVERFRAAHENQMPDSLQSLVPNFAPAIPRDLFDDQPLRFKPLTNGYVVYSIGIDGVDNGGMEKTNSTLQKGFDVTVTVER